MRHHVGQGGFHIDASAHGREVMHCNTKLLAQAGAGKAVLAQLWGCKRMFLLPIAKAQSRQLLTLPLAPTQNLTLATRP